MKKTKYFAMFIAILAVLFICTLSVNATVVDANIYSDTTISTGQYGTVNIYDSLDIPPIQTNVDMTGGVIEYCNVYDTANFNLTGGDILLVRTYDNSIAYINSNVSSGLRLHNNSKVYLNALGASSNILMYDDAELHIYGYNLEYDEEIASLNKVTGQWRNGQDFRICLRNITTYNPEQVFLHEIPEPATILLFTLGGFLLRRTRK